MKAKNLILNLLAVILFFGTVSCKKDKAEPQDNTVTDIDGNVYKTVKIGNQVWMAENLKVTKLNDDTPISHISAKIEWGTFTSPAYCAYENSLSNFEEYGALYNWHAVNSGKLAPKGWHIPTDEEWTILENYLIENGYNFDGSTAGNKIAKSLATASGWESSTVVGAVGNTDYPSIQNKTGFSAKPSGYRFIAGSYNELGSKAYWWSTTDNGSYLCGRSLLKDKSLLNSNGIVNGNGNAVRCIKNN